jgi:hypothetical protein
MQVPTLSLERGMVPRKPIPPGAKVFRYDAAIDLSFTMLTANANDQPLTERFHRPGADEGWVVIVRPSAYENRISPRALTSRGLS